MAQKKLFGRQTRFLLNFASEFFTRVISNSSKWACTCLSVHPRQYLLREYLFLKRRSIPMTQFSTISQAFHSPDIRSSSPQAPCWMQEGEKHLIMLHSSHIQSTPQRWRIGFPCLPIDGKLLPEGRLTGCLATISIASSWLKIKFGMSTDNSCSHKWFSSWVKGKVVADNISRLPDMGIKSMKKLYLLAWDLASDRPDGVNRTLLFWLISTGGAVKVRWNVWNFWEFARYPFTGWASVLPKDGHDWLDHHLYMLLFNSKSSLLSYISVWQGITWNPMHLSIYRKREPQVSPFWRQLQLSDLFSLLLQKELQTTSRWGHFIICLDWQR